ncbi:hypothetical protein ACLB2K_032141 [Fragaria x ananassa]
MGVGFICGDDEVCKGYMGLRQDDSQIHSRSFDAWTPTPRPTVSRASGCSEKVYHRRDEVAWYADGDLGGFRGIRTIQSTKAHLSSVVAPLLLAVQPIDLAG